MFLQDKDLNFVKVDDSKAKEISKGNFVVALDFDGVISNPYKLKTKFLNEKGYKIKEEDCSALSCLKIGVPKEVHDEAVIKAFSSKPEQIPLEKNFKENYKKLKEIENLSLFIVTSRDDNLVPPLEEYLKFYKINVSGIINTKRKSKSASLLSLEASVFVDDSPFKLWQILDEKSELSETCKLILYRNIQNFKEKNPSHKIVEVNNWEELCSTIQTLKNLKYPQNI